MKLLIGICAWYDPHYMCVDSVYKLKVPSVFTERRVFYGHGWEAAQCRNKIVEEAKLNGYDYIFFVDADQIFMDPNTLEYLYFELQNVQGEIITCWGRDNPNSKGVNVFPLADDSSFLNAKDPWTLREKDILGLKESSIKISACGFGGVLVRTSLFSKLERPYFEYKEATDTELFGNEDVRFCKAINAKGIPLYLCRVARMQHLKKVVV